MPERFKCYRKHYSGVQSTMDEFEVRAPFEPLPTLPALSMLKAEA